MTEFKIIYGAGRFPKRQRREDGTWGCRGCGSAIPKHRKTWCSRECNRKYDPGQVLIEVRKRDKDVCCFCGLDMVAEMNKWNLARWEHHRAHGGDYAWRQENPKPHKPNYDHIIPFSEGGLTVLENMRTLCEPCHKKRTKEWHKERVSKKHEQEPNLL